VETPYIERVSGVYMVRHVFSNLELSNEQDAAVPGNFT
jgi:hypothetical protein